MTGPIRSLLQTRVLLLVVAAPAEAAAVRAGFDLPQPPPPVNPPGNWPLQPLTPEFDLLETGVGKANAAAAVALRFDAARHGAVINLGICGSLRPLAELPIGSVVLAESSAYADEGVQTPDGFRSLPEMGFPFGPFPGSAIPPDPALFNALRPLASATGTIATVSTCSGDDALAAAVAKRTGAVAEAMEGAAIAHALARLHPPAPFAELRVVSNSTGDRPRQVWDIRAALDRLRLLTAAIRAI